MKGVERRLAKLETARSTGAARRASPEEAFAHAELTKIMDGIAAEKAAGDVHGIAARQLAELNAMSAWRP